MLNLIVMSVAFLLSSGPGGGHEPPKTWPKPPLKVDPGPAVPLTPAQRCWKDFKDNVRECRSEFPGDGDIDRKTFRFDVETKA